MDPAQQPHAAPPSPSPEESILHEAHRLIHGHRQADYGKPEDCFTNIAELWTAYLEMRRSPSGPLISPRMVADMMILLKIARGANRPTRDGYTDIAGFAGCVEMMGEIPKRPPLDGAPK